MTNVVLLGGNGYIGRNVTEKWLNALVGKMAATLYQTILKAGQKELEKS